ncbi:alpha/beta fold hydrolase [Occultella aeris]|uniref:Acyl-CoA esterase n=1 Tax=Occultella aeris TaxID=2761496 RepID=A0A7M4DJW0_9MICO|nr:alpha/beta hydrolase [Occultella aeris]VZO37345.1 acyl-CoA esterase [Occultella aeris]
MVPDLPGYGKREDWSYTLGIPALGNALLEILDRLELDKVVLVGNSMGCPVILDVAHAAPDRVDRMVLVSPAGGAQNQPLSRAAGQLAVDAVRENPAMARVAVPDYLRFRVVNAFTLFGGMTRYPSLERLIKSPVPARTVLGSMDPLMPTPSRVREVGRMVLNDTTVALLEVAPHSSQLPPSRRVRARDQLAARWRGHHGRSRSAGAQPGPASLWSAVTDTAGRGCSRESRAV